MITPICNHITTCDGCRAIIAEYAIEASSRLHVRDLDDASLCVIDLCTSCSSKVYNGVDVTVKLNRTSLG